MALAFKQSLFSATDKVLAAVSGGLDSVVMLDLLVELKKIKGFALSVAHLNHQIRGRTAGRDADWAESLAAKYGLPFHLGVKNVPALAAQFGWSLEDAGRRARYEFFLQEAGRHSYNTLALAHHADDQAETMLLRLLRGAAARGLSGIAEERTEQGVRIVRPLLAAAKLDILNYATEKKLVYHEDETNTDTAYTRNKLRWEILPLLKAINPNYQEGLRRTAEILRGDDEYLAVQARRVYAEVILAEDAGRIRLDAVALQNTPRAIARRVVRLAVEKLCGALDDISLSFVENFLDNGLTTLGVDGTGRLLVSK
ncbi:tRNA(Ile)-lysidine synthetase [Candidatus Termititenax persephonae]|uniref:tRNA(Ile)-lysidine synthase n=1 Tax=Candidatus Termititenax persephonae TaxID=2218525 RepID=A0A388TGH1_9BACT|nr:tRNA(Ile)-lysidine synthetase [Candidatus Termititenax persephonae]